MPRRRFNPLHLLLLILFPAGADAAGTPLPVGGEFQVNTYTRYFQSQPAVAVDGRGNFVVVWASDACSDPGPCERGHSSGSNGWDTSDTAIHGQRFDLAGTPLGSEFQVNTFSWNWQLFPAVAADSRGNFVVTWDSYGSNGSDSSFSSVQGQRFDSAGALVGNEFQINTFTWWYQQLPAVAIDGGENFVVVWQSLGIRSYGIRGQRFDSAGAAVGAEFQVDADPEPYTIGSDPAVAFDADGDFVVVWDSSDSTGSDSSGPSVQGRRFDSAGAPVGSDFQVNTYTTGLQVNPAVAVDGDGDFVVVWRSYGSSGSDSRAYSIQGQRFGSAGAPVGGEFQVNTYTTGYQRRPAVSTDRGGNFVVVWESDGSSGSDSSDSSIQGQLFDSAGAPVGGEFQVNTYTTSSQELPAVSAVAGGSFVVVWESVGSSGSDTSFRSIQGQRFAIPLFADGFESGDTSAWSNAVP